MRRTAPLMLAAALAAICCRAQEQAPAPVVDAAAPAASAVQAGTPAQPVYSVQVHSFHTFVKRLYSVRALTSTLPAALVEQVHDWPDQWGKDRLGFEKRVASLYGQFVIGVGLEETVKAIHYEDTRYRRLGQGNFFRRTAHVITDTVTARRQDGSRTPAWSLAANAYGSWGIATLWSPPQYRTAASIVEWGSSGMGTFAVSNLAREYWPDIKSIFHRTKAN
ncbi:MAG: hypothetical protein ABSH42_00235 [Bryobacteraceae bacterium]